MGLIRRREAKITPYCHPRHRKLKFTMRTKYYEKRCSAQHCKFGKCKTIRNAVRRLARARTHRPRARGELNFSLKVYNKSTTTTLKIQNLAYPITCDPIWRAASRRLNKTTYRLGNLDLHFAVGRMLGPRPSHLDPIGTKCTLRRGLALLNTGVQSPHFPDALGDCW